MLRKALLALLLSCVSASAQIEQPPVYSVPPIRRATMSLGAQAANVNQPTLYNTPISALYRLTCYIVVTQAATTSSAAPTCQALFTDAATSQATTSTAILNTNTLNAPGAHDGGTAIFTALQGSNVGFSTSGYTSVGATPMQYQVVVTLEVLQ